METNRKLGIQIFVMNNEPVVLFYILLTAQSRYDPVEVAENFKCPNPDYCYGYENTDTNGYYLTTLKLSCGKTNVQLLQDAVLQGIVAYDTCTKNDAYIGQINAITVSSFSGANSGVWGMDYACNPTLRDPKNLLETRTKVELQEAGKLKSIDLPIPLKVYDVKPLLEATEALFGNVDNRKERFPPLPGAHVPCAAKSASSELDSKGNPVPGYVWSYIALAIANDRWNDSSLFIEDCGFYASPTDDPPNMIVPYLDSTRKKVINSVLLCGLNQKVTYKEVFIGYKYLYCGPSEYGQALVCGPYVLLAGSAYPDDSAQALVDMNLSEWAEAVLPKNSKPVVNGPIAKGRGKDK